MTVWTKKRPTKVGYYWTRHPTYTHPGRIDIAEVSYSIPFGNERRTWWVTVRGFRSLIHEHDGAWWLPIPTPDFPQEEE